MSDLKEKNILPLEDSFYILNILNLSYEYSSIGTVYYQS